MSMKRGSMSSHGTRRDWASELVLKAQTVIFNFLSVPVQKLLNVSNNSLIRTRQQPSVSFLLLGFSSRTTLCAFRSLHQFPLAICSSEEKHDTTVCIGNCSRRSCNIGRAVLGNARGERNCA